MKHTKNYKQDNKKKQKMLQTQQMNNKTNNIQTINKQINKIKANTHNYEIICSQKHV